MPRRRRNLDVKQITALYLAGLTVPQVAAITQCGGATVWRRLKEAGVTTRRRGTQVEWRVCEIEALKREAA
jgi:predicted DNA-binding transcriptional regulator AlpA